jgi:hypothetical protein
MVKHRAAFNDTIASTGVLYIAIPILNQHRLAQCIGHYGYSKCQYLRDTIHTLLEKITKRKNMYCCIWVTTSMLRSYILTLKRRLPGVIVDGKLTQRTRNGHGTSQPHPILLVKRFTCRDPSDSPTSPRRLQRPYIARGIYQPYGLLSLCLHRTCKIKYTMNQN